MEYLKNTLNKNIYNIIYNYLDQSEDHLTKLVNKIKHRYMPHIKDLSLLDLLCKTIHYGYDGICIHKSNKQYIESANNYIKKSGLNYIVIENDNDSTLFYIKSDRPVHVINITALNLNKYDIIPKIN